MYLHGVSQWDGDYDSIAENGTNEELKEDEKKVKAALLAASSIDQPDKIKEYLCIFRH